MLDTVDLGFEVSPTQKQLEDWKKIIYIFPGPEPVVKYVYNTTARMPGNWSLNARFYPQNLENEPHPMLLLQFSLPKVLFGNNYHLLFDFEQALSKANAQLSYASHIPTVDLNSGILHRLDYCCNYQVGERVPDYIRLMRGLNFPHRHTKPYGDEGVQFHSKVKTTKFYDKQYQCKDLKAYGLLRHETTIHHRTDIQKLLGICNPTLYAVDIDSVQAWLEEDLEKLRLNHQQIFNREIASEKLVSVYGPKIGDRLLGYLVRSQTHTKQEMMEKFGQSRTTIYRNERLITDAGVALVLNDNVEPLSSLKVEFSKNETKS